MAVSQNTQNGLYASHADLIEYPRSRPEAEARRDELRATGEYRRVEVRTFNNGSRARPLTGYIVNAWKA